MFIVKGWEKHTQFEKNTQFFEIVNQWFLLQLELYKKYVFPYRLI